MVDGYPYESKLEANILGSLITNEGILVNNIRFLDEGCFYLDKHKKVFNVIKELFTENKQVDLISVTHQLKKNKSNVDDLFVSDLCSSSTSYNTPAINKVLNNTPIVSSIHSLLVKHIFLFQSFILS